MNDSLQSTLDDLNSLVKNSTDLNHRRECLDTILGLTGADGGCELLCKTQIIETITNLLPSEEDDELIFKFLVNISSTSEGSAKILSARKNVFDLFVNYLATNDTNSQIVTKILANLTRSSVNLNEIIQSLSNFEQTLKSLNEIFHKSFEKPDDILEFIAMVFSNFTAHSNVRKWLLLKENSIIRNLLPFISFSGSIIIRAGIVGLFKNLAFEVDAHDYLLKELEILTSVLFPLAGNETLSDEDNDKLPVELQYLEDSKEREPVASIRKDLLETLNKFCTTQSGRNFLRDNNAYVILREYHKWEQNREILLACENVVDILIRTEEEIGRNNLVDGLEVPDDMVEKFEKLDASFINDQ